MVIDQFLNAKNNEKELLLIMDKCREIIKNNLVDYEYIKDNEQIKKILYKPCPNPLNDYDQVARIRNVVFEEFIDFQVVSKYNTKISFDNCVFMEGVILDHDNMEVEYSNCLFLSSGPMTDIPYKKLMIYKSVFSSGLSIDFAPNDISPLITIKKSLFLDSLEIGTLFRVDNRKLEELTIEDNTFIKEFKVDRFIEVRRFSLSNNINKSDVIINHLNIIGTSNICNNSIEVGNLFSLKGNKYEDTLTINFQNVMGKILFTETSIKDNVFFDEDYLSLFNYDQLKLTDESFIQSKLEYMGTDHKHNSPKVIGLLVSKWNFYNISVLFDNNKNQVDERLRCYYEFKHFDRLKRKVSLQNTQNIKIGKKIEQRFKLVIDILIEKTTGYFTSPKHILITSAIVLLLFSLLNYITYKSFGSKVNGNKVINSIYFSLVSFTTIGYGDMSHSYDLMKLLSGLQGIIGTLLSAALITTITRRYLD